MSQKTDNMIKLALVFFVTLLSFSIGTYVGKKYSDNQHKLSLLEPKKTSPVIKTDEFATEIAPANLTPNTSESEVAEDQETLTQDQAEVTADATSSVDSQKPAALSDAEVAKIAEEFAAEDEVAEEKLVATINPPEKDLKTISDETLSANPLGKSIKKADVKPVTQKLAQKNKVVEKPAEISIPASLNTKKDLSPIFYTVQIGSYPTEAEAEKITRNLQDKGYKTSFVPADVNGQMWYRVNVGLFGSVKEAQEYKKEFLVKTKLPSAIVQRVLQ